MKFSEYIDKLKSGTLTKEEEEFVKEEIEKHEVIADYIYGQEEDEFSKVVVQGANIDEVKKVNSYVNKKILIKIGVSLLIILLLGLAVNLSMNLIYYNPNKGYSTTKGKGDGQLSIDAAAFTELHFPGYEVEYADAKPEGFGSYEINITQRNMLSDKEETYKDRIIRGTNQGAGNIHKNFWRFPVGATFMNQSPDMRKNQLEKLRELPKSSEVSVYVEFQNSLTLKEFEEMDKKHGNVWFDYVAVETGEKPTYGWGANSDNVVTGFVPSDGGTTTEKCKVPEDKYPYFTMLNHQDDIDKNKVKVWEQHFKTLLKYMSDRPRFLSVLGYTKGINKDFYKNALEYVDKNGVKIYGAHVQGKVDTILNLEDQIDIKSINADNAILSSLSR